MVNILANSALVGCYHHTTKYKISQTQKSLKSFDLRLFTFVAGAGLEPTTFGL